MAARSASTTTTSATGDFPATAPAPCLARAWWRIRPLSDLDNDDGDDGLNDELTSAQFFADCDAYYDPAAISFAWDVDGDGTYETPAGASVSAAALDGPAVISVAARAVHSMDGRSGAGAATVTVVTCAGGAGPGDAGRAGRVIGVEVPFAIAGCRCGSRAPSPTRSP